MQVQFLQWVMDPTVSSMPTWRGRPQPRAAGQLAVGPLRLRHQHVPVTCMGPLAPGVPACRPAGEMMARLTMDPEEELWLEDLVQAALPSSKTTSGKPASAPLLQEPACLVRAAGRPSSVSTNSSVSTKVSVFGGSSSSSCCASRCASLRQSNSLNSGVRAPRCNVVPGSLPRCGSWLLAGNGRAWPSRLCGAGPQRSPSSPTAAGEAAMPELSGELRS
jgi:hypothetical protein